MGSTKSTRRNISSMAGRISMNSLGDLHGRVDFSGIETERAQRPIYQKLKVIQTWVFIQTLAIALLTAYLIVLTVWLAPFFPMNYDNDDDVDDNTAAIASLQANQTTMENQVETNTDSIKELQESQHRQDRRINRLNAAVEALQGQVGNLTSQMESLNATVVQLQDEVDNNTAQNQDQAVRIQNLEVRVTLLETTVGVPAGIPPLFPAPAVFADDARTRAVAENLLARVTKLECFKEVINGRVKKLDNDTQERFCNLTKTIGDVYGECMDTQKQTMALKAMVDGESRRVGVIDDKVADLRTDLDGLNDSNTREHNTFAEDISSIRTNLKDKYDALQNKTDVLTQTSAATAARLMNLSRETREKLTELDSLRELKAEESRVQLEEEAGKLRCEIAELEESMKDKLETCNETISLKTKDALNQAQGMVDEAKEQLEGLLEDTKKNISLEITDVNATVYANIGNLKSDLEDEIRDREIQYTHLCDRVDGVQNDTRNNFTVVEGKIDAVDITVQNLSSIISSMQEDEIGQEERLSGLNTAVDTQNLAFLQFKSEAIATHLDLRNQTCTLRGDLEEVANGQKVLEVRITNSENRVNTVEMDLTAAILEAEVKHIRSLAELHAGQTDIVAQTTYLTDAYAQLTNDLGGGSHIRTLVEKLQQVLPQISSPRPQTSTGPRLSDGGVTQVSSDSEPSTSAKSDSDGYDDDDYYADEEE